MAKIGLTNLWYGKLTEGVDGTPTYDGAHSFGKAISCSVEVTNNEAMLYADDTLAESDKRIQKTAECYGVTTIISTILQFFEISRNHFVTTSLPH